MSDYIHRRGGRTCQPIPLQLGAFIFLILQASMLILQAQPNHNSIDGGFDAVHTYTLISTVLSATLVLWKGAILDSRDKSFGETFFKSFVYADHCPRLEIIWIIVSFRVGKLITVSASPPGML